MMLNGPCTTTVNQPVHGKTYNMACVLPEKNQISLRICKFLIKSLMDTLWVANDKTVKRTTKTGLCRNVPTDLSHLGSVGFAAFRLIWIGVVLTMVVLTRDPFLNVIYFYCRTEVSKGKLVINWASKSFIALISWYTYLRFVN